ncbi:ABC transporter permease subunit [Fulvimarina endophytica]|uniref:ABC transporter permease subunit n=1 Tax=Fulvimarina endophytica TaxID=2293836 RepID=A0A371WXR9_9HYPH|nr:ABC transporter permease subunit [Fulvimarina endophytica]RFC61782.1 ABC transporter permease subunit [Fulvimarina endophytica]
MTTLAPRGRATSDAAVGWCLTLIVAVPFVVFLVVPLASILVRGFETPDGLGLQNFTQTFGSARFWDLTVNSLAMAGLSTVIVVSLAYGYAYALQRTAVPLKPFLRIACLVPLFAPSLVQAQGLVLLLGRNGFLNRFLGFDIDIYGFWGVVIASSLYAFPYAFLILSAALAVADARIYDSAEALGAGPLRIFKDATLPATRFGLVSACFIAFTLVVTDFGNPIVIGGDFSVLATEMYNQVIGQAQFGLGAVIGIVLLVPAIVTKLLNNTLSGRTHAIITDGARPLTIEPSPMRDLCWSLFVYGLVAVILSVPLIVLIASFTQLWPYNMAFSLRHYHFDVQNGLAPFKNSLIVSASAATIGVVLSTLAALVANRFRTALSGPIGFLSILPSAVPGMVLGLGYLVTFNDPANPLGFLYGTLTLLVVMITYYNFANAYLTASTSLGQIGKTFDEASTMLGGSRLTTLFKITLPLLWPTMIGMWVFYFMRTMVTLSAIIFLITPSTQMASVSVLQLSDRGAINQAAAFSICIMAVVVLCLALVRGLLILTGNRHVALIR